jgi:pyruvate/2-oxoglutarate dehydrogenase complex dihydrolipoamide dehydrogenase (E3) component
MRDRGSRIAALARLHAGYIAADQSIRRESMPETIRPDICVVGAGAGGLQAAAQAAAFGVAVVLVAKGGLGAAVIRSGRLPLAALAAAGRRAHLAAQASALGIEAAGPIRIDFSRVQEHVREIIAARAPNAARERLTALGVRVIEGAARFKDARTLTVDGEIEIAARRTIIATGSLPALPPIAGLAAVPHLTTEAVLDLEACPEHLLVLGAGGRAMEFAQAFRRLGAAVTVIDAAAPLADEDPECAAVVLDQLAREGITVRHGLPIRVDLAAQGSGIRVKLGGNGEETIGSHVLIAGGRWANVVGLGLDAAGIKYDEHGIAVDKALRTTNKRVHAIGEVAGAIGEAADQQAGLVIRNALLRLPASFNPDAIPRVILTDPELAQAGLTEAQARDRGYRVRVLRWPYRENDRAQAEREPRGHIKIVTTMRGRILGVTIVGAGTGELIAAWTLAIGRRTSLKAMAGVILPYPTRSDIGKWAATTSFMSGSASSWARRMIGWLRRLG